MKRLARVVLDVFAGTLIGAMFGFALFGGVIARVAYEDARIEQAEARQFELTHAIEECKLTARDTQDSLKRLKRILRTRFP